MDSKANDKFPQKTEDPEEKTACRWRQRLEGHGSPEARRDKEDILFPRTHVEIEAQPTP